MTKIYRVGTLTINVPTITNHEVLNAVYNRKQDWVEPVIPKYYDEDTGEWEDNTFSEVYVSTTEFSQMYRGELALDWIYSTLEYDVESILTDSLLQKHALYCEYNPPIEFNTWYLKNHVFTNVNIVADFIYHNLLTENLVASVMEYTTITRHGFSIYDYPIKNQVDSHIEIEPIIIGPFQLVHPFHEFVCVTESGLDWSQWSSSQSNNYSLDFKAMTVAYYRMHSFQKSHVDDAVALESERKAKH